MSAFFDNLRKISSYSELNASHQTLVDLFSVFAVAIVVTFILSWFYPWAIAVNLFSFGLYFLARWRWYKHLAK